MVRLVDMMNDPRLYIPIELEDGSLKVVNKSTISTIALLERDMEEDHREKRQDTFAMAGSGA